MRACLSAAAIAATTVLLGAQPDRDWPQLYGTARNSTAARIGPNASLSIAWKTPMPTGSAGIVAAGDSVYTLGSDGEQDILFALDAATGKESWRVTLGQTHADAITNGPGGTPVISGDLVVAVSSRCQVQAVNSTTRQVAWTHDLGAEFASRFAKRGGCAVSPLLAGSRIVSSPGRVRGRSSRRSTWRRARPRGPLRTCRTRTASRQDGWRQWAAGSCCITTTNRRVYPASQP